MIESGDPRSSQNIDDVIYAKKAEVYVDSSASIAFVLSGEYLIFTLLVLIFGLPSGIGEGSDYRIIREQFLGAVGTVGGAVGLIGALGGFVLPVAAQDGPRSALE